MFPLGLVLSWTNRKVPAESGVNSEGDEERRDGGEMAMEVGVDEESLRNEGILGGFC